MQMPSSAQPEETRSTVVLRRYADTIPTGTAISSESAMAMAASCRLGRMRRLTFSTTGSPLRIERPRSPRNNLPIQAAYCTAMGRSRPRSRRSVSFAVASTDSAIIASIGSPGVRWRSAKTPAVTSRRTGTVAPSRRRSRVSAALPQPDVLEAHHPVGDRLVALHPEAEGLGLDRIDDVEHGQLLLEELRQLGVELLALNLIGDLAGLVEDRVDRRIGDAGPVERGARRGLEELVDVAVGVGPAAPLVADHLEVLGVAVREQRGAVHELDLHGDRGL